MVPSSTGAGYEVKESIFVFSVSFPATFSFAFDRLRSS